MVYTLLPEIHTLKIKTITQREVSETIGQHAASSRSHAINFTRDTEDANDLLQETLLEATRSVSKFEGGSNLKGCLFVIRKEHIPEQPQEESQNPPSHRSGG